MNVGKLHDPETVEGFWQPLEVNSLVLDREHVRLTQRSASDVRQTQRQGPQRGVSSFGTANRRDTSALVPSDGSSHYCLGYLTPACRGGVRLVGRIIET
jgi:hypothetical protein